jgi:hypothetical protein
MSRTDNLARPSIDARTRPLGAPSPVDAAAFWNGEWRDALAGNGERAAADAERLGLAPIAIAVDGDVWTLRRAERTLEVVPGRDATTLRVVLDRDAFTDLVREHRTALGLVVGARVDGDPDSSAALCAWDPVLRCALDGRGVYQPGDVTLRASDGSPLELDRRFRLGEQPAEAAHFLAEAGFLLLQGVFTDEEMDAVDGDLARAVDAARPDDGESWWATTRSGERYPCRILEFAHKSTALRALLADPRFLAIGELLGDGHRPGDPFGEHFAEVTAEGLVKRVDSVEGLSCLPWHKDCERGGLGTHGRLLPYTSRRGARRARRHRWFAPVEHRPRPGRRGTRSPVGQVARQSRRPYCACVVRIAPLNPPRQPRAPRCLHGIRAAATAERPAYH